MDDTTQTPMGALIADAGRGFRTTGFHDLLQQLTSLALTDGEVTSAGVLRPATARTFIDRLGLDAWQVAAMDAARGFEMSPTAARAVRETVRSGWRSASDCAPLDRVWSTAVATGLLTVTGRRARQRALFPGDDDGLGRLAIPAVLSLVLWLHRRGLAGPVPLVLLLLAGPTGRPRTKQELVDAWLGDPLSLTADAEAGLTRQQATSAIHDVLVHLGDTGLWQPHGGRYAVTTLGELVWWELSRMIDDGSVLEGGRWAEAARARPVARS